MTTASTPIRSTQNPIEHWKTWIQTKHNNGVERCFSCFKQMKTSDADSQLKTVLKIIALSPLTLIALPIWDAMNWISSKVFSKTPAGSSAPQSPMHPQNQAPPLAKTQSFNANSADGTHQTQSFPWNPWASGYAIYPQIPTRTPQSSPYNTTVPNFNVPPTEAYTYQPQGFAGDPLGFWPQTYLQLAQRAHPPLSSCDQNVGTYVDTNPGSEALTPQPGDASEASTVSNAGDISPLQPGDASKASTASTPRGAPPSQPGDASKASTASTASTASGAPLLRSDDASEASTAGDSSPLESIDRDSAPGLFSRLRNSVTRVLGMQGI